MKLWHNDWTEFVLANENPGRAPGYAWELADDAIDVNIFYHVFDSKADAIAEVQRVNNLQSDDIGAELFDNDEYLVVTVDWNGSNGVIKGLYVREKIK